MNLLSEYTTVIFDCDGVIFDSNNLKIQAMKESLEYFKFTVDEVSACCKVFSENFGKSRYFHVENFLSNYLSVSKAQRENYYNEILEQYAQKCRHLYLAAELTPGVESVFALDGIDFYVASGSDQEELREVFSQKDISKFFCNIYGSPRAKSLIVNDIVNKVGGGPTIMVGDAISDLRAALDNEIDFLAYTPYSNVRDILVSETEKNGFRVIDSWSELKGH